MIIVKYDIKIAIMLGNWAMYAFPLLACMLIIGISGLSQDVWAGAVNTDPIVDAGPDATIAEGDTFSSSGSFTDPDAADTWTATVDYGDTAMPLEVGGGCSVPFILNAGGTACVLPAETLTLVDKTFSLSHTYEQDSDLINGGLPFEVTVTINDGSGPSVDTVLVTVNNVLPIIDPIADVTIDQADTFSDSGSFSDPGSDPWVATVNWGGVVEPVILKLDKTFDLEHTFSSVGEFVVTVAVTDGSSAIMPVIEDFVVTVLNIAPTLIPGTGDTINEGDTFTTSGSFDDPGEDPWILTVDYGDGSGTSDVGFEADKTFELSHIYENDGPFTVTVTLDDGTVTVFDTFEVTVNNVAPTVDAGPDATLDEGDAFLSMGTFTDPSTETLTATVDYGDGGVAVVLALNPDNTFSLDHTYTDDGPFTVTVTVDDGTASDSDDALVTVNNVAPSVSLGMSSVDGIRTFTTTGSFTDPGTDTWTATVDYDDGGVAEALALNTDNTFSLSHPYSVNGAYTVEVIVTDDDGGVGSASTVVGVFISMEGPPPELNSPSAASTSFTEGATFLTTNRDIWGPVTSGTGMIQWELFNPQSWNERGGFSAIKTLAGLKFGASVDAGTFGNVRMFSEASDLQGIASVNNPGNVKLTHGAANSFLAAEDVPITAQWTVGAAKINNAKSMGDLELFLRLNVNAFLKTKICIFGCIDFLSIPTIGFDTGVRKVFSFDALEQATSAIPPFLQGAILGNAMFGPISVTPTTTSSSTTGTIVAQDTNTFATMPIDLDRILTTSFSLPPLGFTSPSFQGFSFGYEFFDIKNILSFIANQKLTFDTDVLVKLDFDRPVAGVMGMLVSVTPTLDGKVSSLTYMDGEQIKVQFPPGETDPITVTPTASLDPSKTKMHNFAKVTTASSLTMLALSAHLTIPEITVTPEINVPKPYPHLSGFECHKFLCFGGHFHHSEFHTAFTIPALKFPGVDKSIGPLWESGPQGKVMVDAKVVDKPFSLGGFNTVTLTNFVLDPEVPPTADANGPYEVLEGSIVLLDGSRSFDIDIPAQPLTHNWDLDDNTSFETSGESVGFFGVDGPALHPVSIEVCDPLNCDTDSSSVTVLNVAPTVSAGVDDSVNEGILFTREATFTDPGADTWKGAVDWGDGTSIEPITDISPSIGPTLQGEFSVNHIYADNGVYTVTLTITDDDEGVGIDKFDVTVNNVVPTVDAGTDQEYVMHDVTSLDPATYSDLGFDCAVCSTLEDFTSTVNWGEGSDESLDVSETPGSPGVLTIGTTSGTHIYRLPGEYTVTVTVPDDDQGTSSDTLVNTILSAQDLKNRAISFLTPYETEKKVEKSIKEINKSLETKLWLSNVYLDKKHGKKVFDHEKHSVKELQKLLKDGEKKGIDPVLKQKAQDSIDLLVNADRVLAITIMLDASSVTSDDPKKQKKIDKENAKSAKEFAKADGYIDEGKFNKAIDKYKKAWQHAHHAIKHDVNADEDSEMDLQEKAIEKANKAQAIADNASPEKQEEEQAKACKDIQKEIDKLISKGIEVPVELQELLDDNCS